MRPSTRTTSRGEHCSSTWLVHLDDLGERIPVRDDLKCPDSLAVGCGNDI
jgi:hypothetical protein